VDVSRSLSSQLTLTVPPTPLGSGFEIRTHRPCSPFNNGNRLHTPKTIQSPKNLHSPKSYHHYQSLPSSRQSNQTSLTNFSQTIGSMETELVELKYIFTEKDAITERLNAAISIQKMFRGYSTRKKYMKYHASLRAWRIEKSKNFIDGFERAMSRAGYICSATQAMYMKRTVRLLMAVFKRWEHVCKQSLPYRRSNMVAAEDKYQWVMRRLKRMVGLIFMLSLKLHLITLLSPYLSICLCVSVSISPTPFNNFCSI
jgi:hypothetical protein